MTISWFGSMALLVNNLTGPGLVALSGTLQKAGWLVGLAMMGAMGVASALASGFLCEAMHYVPGNERGRRPAAAGGPVEFTTVAEHCLPRPAYVLVIVMLLFSLTTTNISSIIEVSQTLDAALLATPLNTTCALELYPHPGFKCIHAAAGTEDSVFGSAYVVTVGFVAALVVTVPLGLLRVDDNMGVQICAFVGIVAISAEWCAYFFETGLDTSRVPLTPPAARGGVVGDIMINFACVTVLPEWLNSKAPAVSTNGMIWSSFLFGTLLMAAIGILGALAFDLPIVGGQQQDMLAVLSDAGRRQSGPASSRRQPLGVATSVAAYLFPPCAILTSIPIFTIVVRHNLVSNGWCGPHWAMFWAGGFPWFISLVLYSGDYLDPLLMWSGLLVTAPLNLMLPCWFYLRLVEPRKVLHRRPAAATGERGGRGGSGGGGGGGEAAANPAGSTGSPAVAAVLTASPPEEAKEEDLERDLEAAATTSNGKQAAGGWQRLPSAPPEEAGETSAAAGVTVELTPVKSRSSSGGAGNLGGGFAFFAGIQRGFQQLVALGGGSDDDGKEEKNDAEMRETKDQRGQDEKAGETKTADVSTPGLRALLRGGTTPLLSTAAAPAADRGDEEDDSSSVMSSTESHSPRAVSIASAEGGGNDADELLSPKSILRKPLPAPAGASKRASSSKRREGYAPLNGIDEEEGGREQDARERAAVPEGPRAAGGGPAPLVVEDISYSALPEYLSGNAKCIAWAVMVTVGTINLCGAGLEIRNQVLLATTGSDVR